MSETTNSGLITVIANDQPRQVQSGSTIADLLKEGNIPLAQVVVQLDNVIVPRSDLAKTVLQQGSKLEIVTLVGGG